MKRILVLLRGGNPVTEGVYATEPVEVVLQETDAVEIEEVVLPAQVVTAERLEELIAEGKAVEDDTPWITDAMREAVAAALGYEAADDAIHQAIAEWDGVDTPEVEARLAGLVARFEAAGGRGVELADEIDMARIAVALRKLGTA